MENWILNLICFLHLFYLSTPSAFKMQFYFFALFFGKNAQNRPKNKQNWYLAKIGPNVNLVNVWTITVALEFWFGQPKCHFWSQRWKLFWQKWLFSDHKNGTSGAKIKFLRPLLLFKHSPIMACRTFISWIYHFWARFWPNFNFVDFQASFGHFSLVKSAKNKIVFRMQKECSNKKVNKTNLV